MVEGDRDFTGIYILLSSFLRVILLLSCPSCYPSHPSFSWRICRRKGSLKGGKSLKRIVAFFFSSILSFLPSILVSLLVQFLLLSSYLSLHFPMSLSLLRSLPSFFHSLYFMTLSSTLIFSSHSHDFLPDLVRLFTALSSPVTP